MSESPFSDLEADWTCGHRAGSMCAECYRELAQNANKLAAEVTRLREQKQELQARNVELEAMVQAARAQLAASSRAAC